MRISRIYLPEPLNSNHQTITIQGDKAHYIKNVLRLKLTQSLIVFDAEGLEYQTSIIEMDRHSVILEKQKQLTPLKPSQLQITIVQGISSSDRMDYTVQKATELGAAKLIPVMTDFCSTRIPVNKYQKKQQHWQNIAISASEQCGRSEILQVQPICQLEQAIVAPGIYLQPNAEKKISCLGGCGFDSVFIGPEGGFSSHEIELFQRKGLTGIGMGQRILRTETAAAAILSALHALYGDFT